ncbi:MAG: HD domain-containing protein [Bosea sp. (in: a-proteobacteria)]|uniref:HD domain-containing protein n=1 Tax=Bosea sp. (in: a-proteobacteria) TaxID=1871050 RepID=UPI002732AE83|nr:HD domain-containing protein [Bosea sp. (in: a-proteobacteria)]MDP3600953.1 HD domain-containing protein [Bosea sp. (in: a-proteobacteria)]
MATLERAIEIAAHAHRNQTDKAGNPYIAHPFRVALGFIRRGDEERAIIAVLHDVIEDTNITGLDLLRKGFSPAIVEAVKALSRDEGETYEAFIERAAANPLARPVKAADLIDNMDAARLGRLPRDQAAKLTKKYEGALGRLGICTEAGSDQ